MEKITIRETTDWKKQLLYQGLNVVIDPMVFRSGELFLKGASGVENSENVWSLLTANLHAISTFFDCLVLNEKIPVFNYGDTFDMHLNFDQRMLTRINQFEDVLYDVDVEFGIYQQVKTAALAELKKIYEGPRKIQRTVVKEILSELSVAEYQWKPNIGELEYELKSNDEKELAAFLLGALIFGGYAQQLEGEHFLQPKRSRILLALALNAKSTQYSLENTLFEELRAKANTPIEDLPWRPTFFPYLLSKATTPTGILKEVVKLRKNKAVADYRAWFNEAFQEFTVNGKFSLKKRDDIRKIAERIDRKLGIIPSGPKVDVKVTVADAIALKPPGSIDVTPAIQGLWGWFLDSLPGNRYRKLLTRAIVADNEYVVLENRVKTVWKAG